MGEEPSPPQMENGYPPNLENQKSEILERKSIFPQKNKIWGIRLKSSVLEQSKITAKPVKCIVPGICGRDKEKGKFAKRMAGN